MERTKKRNAMTKKMLFLNKNAIVSIVVDERNKK